VFVPKPAEFPAWVQWGQKIDHLLIKERISHFHRWFSNCNARNAHGRADAFGTDMYDFTIFF